jgi:hypothetical protein
MTRKASASMNYSTVMGKRWIAALLAVWSMTAAAATEISGADWRAAALLAALGVMAAIGAIRKLALWRTLTMAVVPVAALLDPAALLPWSMAGASLALNLTPLAPESEFADADALHKHLMWCRRRNERVDVLVAQLDALPLTRLQTLVDGTRTTDSLAVRRHAGGLEVYGMLDAADVDRSVVEERLRKLAGGRVSFGWAAFPEHGFTLEALVDEARRGMQTDNQPEPVPFARRHPATLQPAPAMESDATRMVGR